MRRSMNRRDSFSDTNVVEGLTEVVRRVGGL